MVFGSIAAVLRVVVPDKARNAQLLCPGQIVSCPVHSCFGVVVVGCTEFPDDNRNIFVGECGLDVLENLVQFGLVGVRECHVVAVTHCKVIRAVCMNGSSDIVVIFRNLQITINGRICRSCIARNHQQTGVLVWRIHAADGFDEIMVQLVDNFVAGFIASPFQRTGICCSWFVHAFKNQVLVIVCKIGCNLCPHLFQLRSHFIISSCKVCTVDPFFVVQVQDDIHALLIRIVNDFLDPFQPAAINRIDRISACIGGLGHMAEPAGWNPDRIKALCLDGVYHFLGHCRIAPGFFKAGDVVIVAVTGTVQRVADVEAQSHFLCNFKGTHNVRSICVHWYHCRKWHQTSSGKCCC